MWGRREATDKESDCAGLKARILRASRNVLRKWRSDKYPLFLTNSGSSGGTKYPG